MFCCKYAIIPSAEGEKIGHFNLRDAVNARLRFTVGRFARKKIGLSGITGGGARPRSRTG